MTRSRDVVDLRSADTSNTVSNCVFPYFRKDIDKLQDIQRRSVKEIRALEGKLNKEQFEPLYIFI